MSRPKPGIGRELRRTLGHAKVHHSASSSTSAVQLAPVVSQYASGSRSTVSGLPAVDHPATSEVNCVPLVQQLSHLSLIPTWDYLDPFSSTVTGSSRDHIVVPYRPGHGRRVSLHGVTTAAGRLLSPRPIRIGETLLRRPDSHAQGHRTYTSSTAPVHHVSADIQMPFPSLSIPPSLLADKFDSSSFISSNSIHNNGTGNGNHQSSWPFDFLWSSHQPPLEQEMGLVPQQPPSPGPGTVKTREIPETHTVLSPSTPAPQQPSSPSQALLTQYALSMPQWQDTHALPTPPDSHTVTSYSSSLEFKIGASGLAKYRPPPTPPRSPSSSSRERPPPTRSFPLLEIDTPTSLYSVQVGEDAYFTRPDAMCIADGVGGWARSGKGGANAARWSRLLTHFIRQEVDLWWKGDPVYTESGNGRGQKSKGKRSWSEAWRDAKLKEDDGMGLEDGTRRRRLDAVEIMQRGFEKCLSCVMAEGIRGSSTCILALLYHSTLLLANLGDCALLLIRNGEVILRTSEMQHAFNHPLQVGTHSRDEPMKDAMSWQVAVEREDVVVLGSDGLMDNLYDEDILDVLATFAPPHSPPSTPPATTPSLPQFDPQSVSEALCARARQISEQTGATTPFMERAIEEGIDFVGGKKDDITVIVGVVGQRSG